MKQIKTGACFLVATSVLFLFGCDDTATTSEVNNRDTASVALTSKEASTMPAYDAAMDPLTVGAQMSKKLGDTLGLKIYEFTVKPGESWGCTLILTTQCICFRVVVWPYICGRQADRTPLPSLQE